jgi:hypothetical protein
VRVASRSPPAVMPRRSHRCSDPRLCSTPLHLEPAPVTVFLSEKRTNVGSDDFPAFPVSSP